MARSEPNARRSSVGRLRLLQEVGSTIIKSRSCKPMAEQASQPKLEELNLPDGARIIAKELGKYTIYETPDHRVVIDGPDSHKCNEPGIHKAMMEVADITIH